MMKKVVGVAAFAVLGIVALSSCKKDYVCKVDGETWSECIECRRASKSIFTTNCNLIGGSVSTK